MSQEKVNLTASNLLQSILKEGSSSDIAKLTEAEQCRVCSVLCTGEYCVETTQQLEEKLKEKVDVELRQHICLGSEQDVFHK